MTKELTTAPNKASLIAVMAAEYSMDPDKFAATIRSTCMPQNATNEDFAAFLMVARKHGLNPVTREIYAFPKKGGGIQPIVGIDGWMTLINSHPNFDGMEFDDHLDKAGKLTAITCRLFRKDRSRAISVTEYMEECQRSTEPWTKWPARMLRHKAAIQAARYAFSFSGIIDPDEADRSSEVISAAVVAPPPPEPAAVIEHQPAEIEVPAMDVQSAAEILAKAEQMFSNCNSAEDISEVWTFFEDEQERLDPADSERLAAIMYAAEDRLGSNVMAG